MKAPPRYSCPRSILLLRAGSPGIDGIIYIVYILFIGEPLVSFVATAKHQPLHLQYGQGRPNLPRPGRPALPTSRSIWQGPSASSCQIPGFRRGKSRRFRFIPGFRGGGRLFPCRERQVKNRKDIRDSFHQSRALFNQAVRTLIGLPVYRAGNGKNFPPLFQSMPGGD